MENSTVKRSTFSGRWGFILSAAGSAVGLGNIWRFPYLAAQYGGGIFLLVYIILAVTFGFSLMLAEIALGRKTGLSAIGAFKSLNKKFSFVGWLGSLVPVIILPYYCVIGGWVTKYLFSYFINPCSKIAEDTFFTDFIAPSGDIVANSQAAYYEPVLWLAIFAVLTAVVVFFGVENGIEKVSKILMPLLIVLSLVIAVYALLMPGALEGFIYYVKPDFTQFSVKTVLAAMGQMFYSMSLAMGIMITYGSYMKKDVNLEASVRYIEVFDTGIAFLAGLMIIPAVFVFSHGDMQSLKAGPSLMFITLPKVFNSMPGGSIIGVLFFVLVLFAALTSSISLMETVVSILCDKFKCKRGLSCLIVFIGMILIGVPSALGYGLWESVTIIGMQFLDFFDFISNSVLMPIVAFFTCIFVGYIIKPKAIIDEVEQTVMCKGKKLFVFVIKYFAPICIVLILVSSVLSAFGIIKI